MVYIHTMSDMDANLSTLPYDIVLRAKHIVSHLLLPEGAQVIDLECETGALTAAMALLNPRVQFIGMDRNRQMIMRARARFKNIPNLSFETGDAASPRRAEDSVDAIIASSVMGDIYSRANYDDTKLQDTLARYFKLLRNDGVMVIYDYAMPDENTYVQMEFPVPDRGKNVFRLASAPLGETQGEREIALLEWFSKNARARDTIKGFYLEEIAPHVPFTRLFRLPAKWAYEFMIRKTLGRKFKNHIGHQYTCLSEPDFERILSRSIGARILYTAPWRNAHIVRTHYEGSFRLYTAEGKARGYMPPAHIIVAQKVPLGRALKVAELRPSPDAPQSLSVQAVRDDRSGEIMDVVSRDVPAVDIIPYFLTSDGRIKIVLRADAGKGLANLTPRSRANIDGKRWSGHMVSAPTLTVQELEGFDHASAGAVARLMVQKFGLAPAHGKMFETGPRGFPSPAMIDERLETLFINVTKPEASALRVATARDALRLKCYDAEDILRATGAGFIPSAWMDIQIQELMRRHGIKRTPWLHEGVPLAYDPPPADQMLIAKKILKSKPRKDKPAGQMYTLGKTGSKWPLTTGAFRPIRGKAGQITTMRSSFVEQGRIDGVLRGMSAHDMDFAVPQTDHMNIAAIMPLTEDLQGNTLVGFEFKELPVPSRFGQEEAMMNLPTLPLPAHITDVEEARAYIAEQFDVELVRVAPMGESFFTFVDMMPQRVFPFMLTRYPRRRNLRMRYMATTDLLDLTDTDFADSILWKWGFANALLCCDNQQVQGWDLGYRQEARNRVFGANQPKYHSASASFAESRKPAPAPKPADRRNKIV